MALRTFIGCLVSLAILVVAFVALKAAALAGVDDAAIERSLVASARLGVFSGAQNPVSGFGDRGHRFDMFSECVGLGVDLGASDASLIYRIAIDPFITPAIKGEPIKGPGKACEFLLQQVTDGTAKADTPYLRFWHGYLVYLRPLLSVMALSDVRVLNAILLYGALLFLAWRLSRWLGSWAMPALLVPFAIGADLFTLPLVTVHALPLAWVFLSTALLMGVLDRRGAGVALFVGAFICGAIFNYLSFLFNPPLAPALLAFVVLARPGGRAADRARIWQAAAAAGLWFCGFAAAWVAKWALAALVIGPAAVWPEVTEAAAGVRYMAYDRPDLRAPLSAFAYVAARGFPLLGVEASAGWLLAAFAILTASDNRARRLRMAIDFLALQAPALIVVVWIEILRWHSAEHFAFVARSLVVFVIFPLLGALAVRLSRHVQTESRFPTAQAAGAHSISAP